MLILPLPVASGCMIGLISVLYYWDILFTTLTICAHLAVGALGIYLGVSWALVQGKQYTPSSLPRELCHPHISMVLQNMIEARQVYKPGPKKVVISRTLDLALQEIIDLVLRDFIASWYKDLSVDHESLLTYLQTDLWILIGHCSERLSKIDTVQFVTKDVVYKLKKHFQNIRLASKKGNTEGPQNFVLHSWLLSEKDEVNFLRKVSEALLIVVLPKYYAKSTPIRHMLREVVANTVLKPSIDLLCDPDYINLKLLSYIEYREKLSEDTRRKYTYAATYEDFVKMIEQCSEIEQLKQLRFNIMTEIMHATTINNLKGNFADKPGSTKGERRQSTAKGQLLKQRNLKRYINQLTVAKTKCERRMSRLGGSDYKFSTSDTDEAGKPSGTFPGQTVLSFVDIMQSSIAREYFDSFLKRENNESLLGFWVSVENLRDADKKQQHHHIAQEIYQRYICSTTSVVKVDKLVARGMENFMLGDSGPDAFFDAQQTVYKLLEREHYPSFLVSDLYHRYITFSEAQGGEVPGPAEKDELFFEPKEGLSDEEMDEMFSAQAYHAKQKLQQLDAKITNKSQALDALRTSSRADEKLLKVAEEMEMELNGLVGERKKLESHIERTEKWCENIGKWTAHIYEAETVLESDNKKVPVFVIVIHLSGSSSQNLQNSSQGWVVSRKLQDFYAVHEKLVQIAGSWLKNKELPKVGIFTSVDAKFLKEAKTTLNDYLKAIMKDERLAHSEALYGFLTPTPEYFQQPQQEKKTGFFLKNVLKSFPSIGQDSRDTDEELLFYNEDRTEDRSKDSIAEPLYELINEVYELHGMFKWLRKSFIAFVEVTFGRSINRQLRETVYWIFSESMLIYYIKNFKDSMWPDGKLADPLPARTNEEKLRTRLKAKEKFLLMQPDAVKTLVGDENARRGTIKMFEVLQDVRLNKHLFYELMLLLLCRMIPELEAYISPNRNLDESEEPFVISAEQQIIDTRTVK